MSGQDKQKLGDKPGNQTPNTPNVKESEQQKQSSEHRQQQQHGSQERKSDSSKH